MFATGDSVTYCYNTSSQKLRVKYFTGQGVSQTNYSGNRIYENGVLSKILTGEGYIIFKGATPVYHYYLTDFQGNNRVVMASSGSVEQVTHYYPGGLPMAESSGGGVQAWKYGAKEFATKLGLNFYDYGARYYDPVLLRWASADEKCKKYTVFSPYQYGLCNPVRYTDPDGKDVWDFLGGVFHSVGSNLSVGTVRPNGDVATNADHYNLGRQVGNVISVMIGLEEAIAGQGLIAGGSLFTAGTGGAGGIVGAPAVAVGSAAVAHGVSVIASATADMGIRSAATMGMSGNYSPRSKGGGKNASHANEKRREAAQQKYEQAKKEYEDMSHNMKREPGSKKELAKKRKEMDHWKRKRDETGENHSQKHKGH